jgi:signal transduction histidine kinase
MSNNKVESSLDLDQAVATVCLLDEASLRGALINLILNAIQAMPDGGKLIVNTKRDSHLVYLTITDTGCGMTEEQVSKIFEPFYTTKSHGLGLGMPYAQNVIEQHQGSIHITSRPQEGTCIYIELPVREE